MTCWHQETVAAEICCYILPNCYTLLMEISAFLAKLMGFTAIAMGVSMALRRKMLLSIFHELSQSRALSYILGTLMFVMGLLIILNHNIWSPGFPFLITALGYFVLIEGAAYLFVSKKFLEKYITNINNKRTYYFIAIGYLVLGFYLVVKGFQS